MRYSHVLDVLDVLVLRFSPAATQATRQPVSQ